ncbi:C40 family peptidase [Streptomyces sp. NPDC092307]|uniref:C40 family peptidase n=1 Tax=Streptomyces sp. NPDC092307 TaxID=3366013 RepID=UPI0038176FFF
MTGTPNSLHMKRISLHVALGATLLAAGLALTLSLNPRAQPLAPGGSTSQEHIRNTVTDQWQRLSEPPRTVLRNGGGQAIALLTDGARTVVLTGPARTFTEPGTTDRRVVTTAWVRLLPQPWQEGAEHETWFTAWLSATEADRTDDLLAIAFQYVHQAPVKRDAEGTPYAGDADFGPLNPDGREGKDLRLEQSDFLDYTGVPYTFRDGTVRRPDPTRYRAMDCSGFMRMIFGYRARYPLLPDDRKGDGLPRTANGIARSPAGTDILPLTGVDPIDRPTRLAALQPGDLLFFKLDARTGTRLDHIGMYLGPDTRGTPLFISSREEANGPTISSKGGASALSGTGYYATALRSAKRL